MNEEIKLDAFDKRIVNELTKDARLPLVKLALKLKVSNTFIHQRIKKLKEQGLLTQAIYQIDPWLLGYKTSAYTLIMVSDAKKIRGVEQALFSIPEIVECVNISGRYALMVKIFAKNNRDLRDIIYGKIQSMEDVKQTNTTFAFETAFRRNMEIV